MERIISFDTIKSAMVSAYDKFKTAGLPEGASEDARVAGVNTGKMGISLRLVDGRKFDVGDTQSQVAIGSILRIPVMAQLLTQMSADELMQKMHPCMCKECKCEKPKGIHCKNIRMVSLIQPAGDAEGKMKVVSDIMAGMMGSAPEMDDKLYKAAKQADADKQVENTIAGDGYVLYDDAPVSIDISAKLDSMLANTEQLASMGATIAADGVNPDTKEVVFDGRISEHLVAMMAAKGPKKMRRPWLVITGVPAMTGFGGAMLAVVPGFGSFAAFSPELMNGNGVPVKAAMALKEILTSLNINAFGSARAKAE